MQRVEKGRHSMSRTLIHPGEILGDELEEIGISGAELSRQIRVPENRISQIIAGKRGITADTALRLGKWFGTTPEFWLNLQRSYELRKAAQEIGRELDAIPTRLKEPA
jgi:addiction module HigA family antidote